MKCNAADIARELESTVKAKFTDKNKGGEFYDADFEQVKAAILDAPHEPFNRLLALADRLQNPDEKDIQAAGLLQKT